jgi:acyl-CoA thioester hydrolase
MPAPPPAHPLFRHAVRVYWEDTDAGGVSEPALRYLRPARLDDLLDDLLDVTVSLRENGRASMTILQQARRGNELLAEGEIRNGCVDAGTFRPRRIPAPLQPPRR